MDLPTNCNTNTGVVGWWRKPSDPSSNKPSLCRGLTARVTFEQILPCHILPNLAKSYLVISCQILPDLTLSYLAKSCQVLPLTYHILPNLAKSYFFISCQMLLNLTLSYLAKSCQILLCHISPNLAKSCQILPCHILPTLAKSYLHILPNFA